MTRLRSLFMFIVGISPFALVLGLAQGVHIHEKFPEPFVAWLFHVNTIAIAFAGFFGGTMDILTRPPKHASDLFSRVAYSVIASVMLLPGIVESFFPKVSISVLMAGSFLASMASQRLVPRVLAIFEAKLGTVLTETETTTIKKIETREIKTDIKPSQE